MKAALCRNPKGIPMAEMSPLARVLVSVLRWGSMGASALLVLFIGIFCWQKWTPEGLVFAPGDKGFLGVMVVLLGLALYLVQGMTRELRG
jgi:hypothetical protein